MTTRTSAKGQKGMLIRGMDGQIWFRQYDKDNNFIDYDILHYDLEIEITDDFAELINTEKGDYLDYDAKTLGGC